MNGRLPPKGAEQDSSLSLRERAERLLAQSRAEKSEFSPIEVARLIHDLSVHQIELELQNEELRNAQNQLERTRDSYARLYHQAPVGYLSLDASGIIRQANQTFADMLGQGSAELTGQSLSGLIAGADRHVFLGRFKAFFKNPDDKSIEARLCKKEGGSFLARLTARWESETSAALPARQPSQPLLLVIVTDISARKAMEDALRDSEARFRSYIEYAPLGVFVADQTGCFVEVNSAAARLTGYEPATLLRMGLPDLLADDHLEAGQRHLAEVVREGFTEGTLRIRRQNGRLSWVSMRAVRLTPERFLTFCQDVTEQVEIEQALRDREARYRAVIDTSLDGFWMVDLQGRLLEVNDAYVRKSGYSRQELLAMPISALDAREESDETATRIAQILHQGGDLFETLHRAKNGLIWPVEVNVAYWPIAGGRLFCFIRDVRQRQRSQALLKARLQLSEIALQGSLNDLLQAALDTAERFTSSQIGFFHFLGPDQETVNLQAWSTHTLRKMCSAVSLRQHYPVSEAGVWAECVRTRTPVIHNDYAHLSRRNDLPEGHPPLLRELTVPVLRNGLVVAVVGVGNKPIDYTGEDIEIVHQLASMVMDAADRKRAEDALQQARERLELALEGADAGLYDADLQSGQVVVDERYLRMLGYRSGEITITEQEWLEQIHPEDRARVIQIGEECWQRRRDRFEVEYRVRHRSGAWIWVLDRGKCFGWDETGQPRHSGGARVDITARREAEDQLRLAAVAFETSEAIFITDREGLIQRVNHAFTRLTGYAAEEAAGQNPRLLKSGQHHPEFYAALWRELLTNGHWAGEIWNRRKNGELYLQWESITAVRDGQGAVTHFVATFLDLTERKAAEESINRLAYYDPLTQLPNRRLLLDRLAGVQAAARRENRYGALLLVDLDAFKHINDALGHEAGDRLLREVGVRLTHSLREEDTVARIGGDEFAVLLINLAPSQTEAARLARTIAEKIRDILAVPFQPADGGYRIGASIGITLFPTDGERAAELLKQAETAMHQAKRAGRNTICFFAADLQAQVEARFVLEADLRGALVRDELRLYLQPQVDQQGRIIGAESLIRWRHPTKGLVSPVMFIPLAEETGIIVPMGEWILAETCRVLARLAVAGWSLRLAVNVSPRQFRQPDFVSRVRAILAATGVHPTMLTLEVTEGLVIEDLPRTIARMTELKALGFHLSIDDFGTGYSSLAYLKRLPFDELKIDRSFVQDAPTDPNDAALVETILAVAQHLHLAVVAEGVETIEQIDFLKTHGCIFFQGYFYGKPQPAAEFIEAILSTENMEGAEKSKAHNPAPLIL